MAIIIHRRCSFIITIIIHHVRVHYWFVINAGMAGLLGTELTGTMWAHSQRQPPGTGARRLDRTAEPFNNFLPLYWFSVKVLRRAEVLEEGTVSSGRVV